MKVPSHRQERRGPDRPAVGDRTRCRACADGTLEFTDRYRLSMSPVTSTTAIPAWVCDRCPHIVFVRAEHQQPAAVRKAARDARAEASRRLMKSRFVRARATRAVEKSRTKKHRH